MLTEWFWVLRSGQLIKRIPNFTPVNWVRCEAAFVGHKPILCRTFPNVSVNILVRSMFKITFSEMSKTKEVSEKMSPFGLLSIKTLLLGGLKRIRRRVDIDSGFFHSLNIDGEKESRKKLFLTLKSRAPKFWLIFVLGKLLFGGARSNKYFQDFSLTILWKMQSLRNHRRFWRDSNLSSWQSLSLKEPLMAPILQFFQVIYGFTNFGSNILDVFVKC